MASAVASSAGWYPRELTVTERNWLIALGLTIASNVLFWVFVRMEELAGYNWSHYRVVLAPSETSMRLLTQAHFVVATSFLLTSSRMRRPVSWAMLAGLAALGGIFCAGFRYVGGIESALGAILFYTYFLVHDFRDQVGFYRVNGDVPKGEDPRAVSRDVFGAPALAFAILAAIFLFGGAFRIGGAARYAKPFDALPDLVSYGIGIGVVAIAIGLAVLLKRRYDRRYADGTVGFVREHRPIFFVFVGTVLALFLGMAVTERGYTIITMHVMTWYVFYFCVLRSQAPAPARPRWLSWKWIRTTPAGFTFFHLAAFLVIVAAAAYWAYIGHNSARRYPTFYRLLSRDAFAYWTIVHITLSFLPGGPTVRSIKA